MQVLRDFGLASLGHTAADFTEPDVIIQIGVPPFRIDVLTDIDGVSFSDCYPNRQKGVLDGVPVFVISLDDLCRNKASTGRAKDAEDLRLLTLKNQDED